MMPFHDEECRLFADISDIFLLLLSDSVGLIMLYKAYACQVHIHRRTATSPFRFTL